MHNNMGFNSQLDDNNNNIYKLAPIQHNSKKFTTTKKLPTKRALFFSSNDAKIQQPVLTDQTTTESSLVTATEEIRNYSLMGDYESNLGYYFSNDSTSSTNGTESVPKYIHYEETYSSNSTPLSTTFDTDLLCSEVLDEDDNVFVQQTQPSNFQNVKRKLFDYLPEQRQQQALPSFARQCLLVIDDIDLMCKEQLESSLRSSPTNEGISELMLLYSDENIQSTAVYSGTVVREKAKTKRKLF